MTANDATLQADFERFTRSVAGLVLLACLFLAGPAQAANVVTDSDMEAAGITNWPHADITDTNSSAKASDQSAAGQSLKGTSATGKKVNVEWTNTQSLGAITGGQTVTLSHWWAAEFNVSAASALGDLFVESRRVGAGAWDQLWSVTLQGIPGLQSGTEPGVDVSAFFTASDDYELRLRFSGKTGNNNTASINTWWDDVVLDVAVAATTTVGDGTEPAGASLCPGGAATDMDAFTLVTDSGTDTVTEVEVTFAAGTAASLSLVEIVSDDGATVYGSQANPADTQLITLGTNIVATTTLTQYLVRVTPKSHANMTAPPGSSEDVTGTVTSITSSNSKVYNDNTSATVTVDNLSTANPVWGTITPGDTQVDLNWTNPADGDFVEVLILRNTASPINDAPTEGQTYTVPGTIGTSDIVYVGAGTNYTDTGLTNGTDYWYEIFARDTCINWSTGNETGPHQPVGNTITVGDGTEPGNASLCPGDGATMLDEFTLQTDAGTDTVTEVEVTFAAGTAASLSLVEIVSQDGATIYGSQANPTDTQNVVLGTDIIADGTLTPYRVRVTPKTHANMAAPPGSSEAVTGTVTAITSSNAPTYSDATSSTVTVDNLSTANPVWGTITPDDGQVDLNWSNPADGDFVEVMILRNTASPISDGPTEGSTYSAPGTIGTSDIVYVGAGTNYIDTGVTNGTDYWYEIFARDTCVNWSTGSETGPHRPGATTTVGDGTEPANASLCPGGVATMLDEFTLQTSGSNDTVTAVEVTFAAGTAASLSLVEIVSQDGATVYGSQANPADTQNVVLGTDIIADGALTPYRVRVTPKAHADMTAPPGSSEAVTGTVSAITSDLSPIYEDATSATVTVDNLSTANAVWGTITPSDGQVDLNWSNPADGDFVEVLILRNTASPITDGPAEGSSYSAPGTIGGSDIVYVGAAINYTDTGLTNGTDYWYEVFARDTCVNWSTGNETGPHRPGATTTVGDGTEPANANLCPGGAATMLDEFTLQTSGSNDTVTAVEVTFAAGTAASLSLVEIVSQDGATVYGSQANPADTQNVALGTNIIADGALTPYRVRVTPKAHADMTAPPGSSEAVTGTVSAITSDFSPVYEDATSATVTVDNLSTADPVWGTITPDDSQVDLNWSNPADGDFAEVMILRNTASPINDGPTEGSTYSAPGTIGTSDIVYVGVGTNYTDTGLTNGTDYWYEIFARDNCVNWSTGNETGPHQPGVGDAAVTTAEPSATVDGCNQITVSAPYTGDTNADSLTTFERGESDTGPWTAACSDVSGVSPRDCVDGGVVAGTTYWYQVTFTDPDGVNGANPQVTGSYTTPACTANDTTVDTNELSVSSCRQLVVAARFIGDDDEDGSTQVEYNTSDTWPGTTACATLTGPSPRTCLIPELTPGATYYVRVTHSDPDGVIGTNPEVLGPQALPNCGTDDAPPTILIMAPGRDAVVGGIDRAKVQVFDAVGLAAVDPVTWSLDGGAFAPATLNANYDCGTNCGVYEFDLDTTGVVNGEHWITVEASDTESPGNTGRVELAFRVYNVGSTAGGSGQMLRRTPGSQLCTDCHNLPTHSSQTTSGKYGNWAVGCLDCHTPHGTANIFLIREQLRTPNSGVQSILFHFDDEAGGGNPGSADGDYSFLGDRSGASNAPYNDGICEGCHTRTTHHRNDTSGGDHTHNADTRCLNCHAHDAGFSGAGGGACLSCHGDAGGSGTTGPNNRRPVNPDFSLQSHHVGTGGTMGGTLTNFDCVVCHAEGEVVDGETATTVWHNDGLGASGNHRIDFWDVDDTAIVYSYDKNAVATAAGAAANWNSANATWRDETSLNLDPFCLSCHDSTGATATFNANDGGSATNPFGDSGITNNYDQLARPSITNIEGMVTGSPPTDGQFSRHAVRAQSTSRYTAYQNIGGASDKSMYEGDSGNLFTNLGTDELGEPVWNDTSVMGCADCHTSDGANGTSGNAHGSGSEYMQKDSSGLATEGTMAGLSYSCFRCHSDQRYQHTGSLGAHTGNASDYVDTTAETGVVRNEGRGNVFGIACMNCHGGTGFGRIHGTSENLGVGQNGGSGNRDAYRFMNGASMRYYDPAGWAGTSVTCYTLGNPDAWGSCDKHGKGTTYDKPLQRPRDY